MESVEERIGGDEDGALGIDVGREALSNLSVLDENLVTSELLDLRW